MSDAPRSAPVEVTIGDRRYRLRGSDPDLLVRLAERVDRTLAEIAGPGGETGDFKVAVLAALNIAGEQEEWRARWQERAEALRERARALEAQLSTSERFELPGRG
jgi:cell division protein ZapA (FtsZ GTPase activity inhibitor)